MFLKLPPFAVFTRKGSAIKKFFNIFRGYCIRIFKLLQAIVIKLTKYILFQMTLRVGAQARFHYLSFCIRGDRGQLGQIFENELSFLLSFSKQTIDQCWLTYKEACLFFYKIIFLKIRFSKSLTVIFYLNGLRLRNNKNSTELHGTDY